MPLMKMKLRKNIEISCSRETLSSNQRRKFSTSIEWKVSRLINWWSTASIWPLKSLRTLWEAHLSSNLSQQVTPTMRLGARKKRSHIRILTWETTWAKWTFLTYPTMSLRCLIMPLVNMSRVRQPSTSLITLLTKIIKACCSTLRVEIVTEIFWECKTAESSPY